METYATPLRERYEKLAWFVCMRELRAMWRRG
jgi:hypothetical protein